MSAGESQQTNRYAAPSAEVADIEPQPRSSVTAILIGIAIGSGFTYLILSVASLILLWMLTAQGVPTQELFARAYQNTGYLIVAQCLGFGCYFVGGVWIARLSKVRRVLNALIAGVLTCALAFVLAIRPYDVPVPLWSQIVSLLIAIFGYWGGAWWQVRRISTPKK